VKKRDSVVPGSSALSHPGREKYAHLRSQGYKAARAAKLCHISKNTACRWAADGEVKVRIAFLTEQSLQNGRDEIEGVIRPITVRPNDIVMTLWEIGSKGESERARVSALVVLADIFLLRARCIQDLRTGIGWTEEESVEFFKTQIVPARIALITGDRTGKDLVRSLNAEKEKKNSK
jgi:hypothetical protein